MSTKFFLKSYIFILGKKNIYFKTIKNPRKSYDFQGLTLVFDLAVNQVSHHILMDFLVVDLPRFESLLILDSY